SWGNDMDTTLTDLACGTDANNIILPGTYTTFANSLPFGSGQPVLQSLGLGMDTTPTDLTYVKDANNVVGTHATFADLLPFDSGSPTLELWGNDMDTTLADLAYGTDANNIILPGTSTTNSNTYDITIEEFGNVFVDSEPLVTANDYPFVFYNISESISPNTGALTVKGGVGIEGGTVFPR
ncbi:hypothetical protein HDU76_012180, partial [Blyttiomyces sp. JEL0837]